MPGQSRKCLECALLSRHEIGQRCKFLKKLDVKGSMQAHGLFVSLINNELRFNGMTVLRTIPTVTAIIAWVALSTAPRLVGADSGTPPASKSSTSLSADQVVDHLVRKN